MIEAETSEVRWPKLTLSSARYHLCDLVCFCSLERRVRTKPTLSKLNEIHALHHHVQNTDVLQMLALSVVN